MPTLGEIVPQFIDLYARPRNKDWKGTQSILRKLDARRKWAATGKPLWEFDRRFIRENSDAKLAETVGLMVSRLLGSMSRNRATSSIVAAFSLLAAERVIGFGLDFVP
jgi:hypothetical protein